MTLRVGLLGCGRIAQLFHGPILARLPGVRLVALADPDPASRRSVAAVAPGATLWADWRRPLEAGELDAVVICLPPAFHARAACAALGAGVSVYVEKPLAVGLEDGRAMVEAQAEAGVTAMIGFNFRFHPLVQDARRRLLAGELGRVLAVRTLFASARRSLPGWKAVKGAGGDALADLATHHLDLVPFLLGSPFRPGTLRSRLTEAPEGSLATVTGRLEDGAQVAITASQLTGQGGQRIELLGERGHLVVDLADARPRALERPAGRLARLDRARGRLATLAPAELLRHPGAEPSFGRALARFAEAAARREPTTPDLADGLRALELVEAARSSEEDAA